MVTPEVYERSIRELGLRLAQTEIDRALTSARLSIAVEMLGEVLMTAETNGEEAMWPALRAQLQTLVVTLGQ